MRSFFPVIINLKSVIKNKLIFFLVLIVFSGALPTIVKYVLAAPTTSFTWFNPPIGSSTAPGSFTPSWTSVSDGVVRLLSTSYTYSTNTCGNSWTDLGNASNNTSITLENLTCYRWTFDSNVVPTASPPSLDPAVITPLTSGTLKVFSKSCILSSTWSSDTVTVVWNFESATAGLDCKTEITVPAHVGAMNMLIVGGGGAGGWASTSASQGGGGGGGGGMSYSLSNAKVTPGRTYPIQIGSGALVGANTNNSITCRWGGVDSSTAVTSTAGGTSRFGSFTASGGGCALNTGGVERGSDGGISANGRTGGRGGSPTYRTTRCTGSGSQFTNSILLSTTEFYTTAPCIFGGSSGAAQGISGVGNGTGDNVNAGLQAWEGAGGGGGAWFPTTADGSLDSSGTCVYGNSRWNFYNGCDGWDISGVGAFGGIGGRGIQSTWYQGNCDFYFGGGGGGGGSTSGNSLSSGFMGWTFGGTRWEYRWNSTSNQNEFSSVSGGNFAVPKYAPLGGRGGLGGGGHAATGTSNRTTTSNYAYRVAQSGVDGCGGGGGGGQANKAGVEGYVAAGSPELDRPGKGGNGTAVVQFRVSGSNYSANFNPNFQALQSYKIWPNLTGINLPISINQSLGSGIVCIDVVNPNDTSTAVSSSIRFTGSLNSPTENFVESGTASTLRNVQFRATRIDGGRVLKNGDSWLGSGKMYIRIRYSGVDEIASSACANSRTDQSITGKLLIQYLTLELLPAKMERRFSFKV